MLGSWSHSRNRRQKGEFTKDRARASEQALAVVRGLAAKLDDEDREIVQRIVQNVYNVIDLVEGVKKAGEEKKEYSQIGRGFAACGFVDCLLLAWCYFELCFGLDL